MRRRPLLWVLSLWLLTSSGCASHEEHSHEGHSHEGHAHEGHAHEGGQGEGAGGEKAKHADVGALQARMRTDHAKVHEELEHAEADRSAWASEHEREKGTAPDKTFDGLMAEHRQVIVGLKSILDRQHKVGHDVKHLDDDQLEAKAHEARLKELEKAHDETMSDFAKLHEEHERIEHALEGK